MKFILRAVLKVFSDRASLPDDGKFFYVADRVVVNALLPSSR